MRSLLFIASLIVLSATSFAQPKGYKAVADLPAFQQQLSRSTGTLQSLQSDFVQSKNMAMLADEITSKGVFYYKREDKVRIEYTSPFSYLLIMNAGQILVKDEQKSTRVNARGSKVMQSVNRIMIDCMRGTVFNNPDFKVAAFENVSGYVLSMTPASASVKGTFSQINVYLQKNTFDVSRLNMTEPGGDFTQMDFRNSRKNTNLSDALFKIR